MGCDWRVQCVAQTHSHMHLPGIEPRSHRWRRCIPPLDHRRLNIEETAEHCASRRDPFTIWLNLICKVRCTSAGEAFCLKTETSSRLIHFRPAPAALAPWGSAPGQLQTIAGLASGGRIAFWASLVREKILGLFRGLCASWGAIHAPTAWHRPAAKCICRELSPGHIDGNDVFYH